eukprot:1377229-Lingulodinium_polyedra.AAC.1
MPVPGRHRRAVASARNMRTGRGPPASSALPRASARPRPRAGGRGRRLCAGPKPRRRCIRPQPRLPRAPRPAP